MMNAPTQFPNRETFYKFDLTSGAYEYILPVNDATGSHMLHDWLEQNGDKILGLIHPDDRPKVRDHFDKLYRREPDQVYDACLEYRMRWQGDLYRWFRDRHVLVFNSDSRPHALIGTIRDVTAEKDAEVSLQTYVHIVSASSDFLTLIDRQYIYRAISNAYAQCLQQQRESLIGRSMADIMSSDVFESVLKPKVDRCLGGERVSFQLWQSFPNGERRLLDVVYAPHFKKGCPNKTICACVERARDITAVAKLEEQLRQSGKLETIGMLTGSIAHDFNNILSSILGYSEISLQMADKASALYRYLERILQAGHRASALVKQILNFSRKGERDIRPVQIKHIVDEVLSLIRASLPVTITIEKRLESEAFVMCDSTQIYQILINLCSNAGYAMRKQGGCLTVRLTSVEPDARFIDQHKLKRGRYIQLCVSDTGQGMKPEIQKHIFDPFFTTKEKGKGTGLGLSLTHDIIKCYGGAITVESAPDKGTTFGVFLPALDGKQFIEGEPVPCMPTGHERILFVDDEDALADLGKQMLESLGYRVSARVGSLEALSLFRSNPNRFDLVITDLVMPDLTGDELVRKIHDVRSDIPVILVTGFTEQMTDEHAASIGIDRLLIKPVLIKDVANCIREVLARR